MHAAGDPAALARLSALLTKVALHEDDVVNGTVAEINYEYRNRLVLCAVGEAAAARIPVGIRLDATEPEWPVVYFELPAGQVSWHLPQHERAWDGHAAPEKYDRIMAFRQWAGRVVPELAALQQREEGGDGR